MVLLWNDQVGSSSMKIRSGRVMADAECGVGAGGTCAGHVARKSLLK